MVWTPTSMVECGGKEGSVRRGAAQPKWSSIKNSPGKSDFRNYYYDSMMLMKLVVLHEEIHDMRFM
jgi:hypothetical protein